MPTPTQHELLSQVVAAYEYEYRDSADNWKVLDTKAQGSVAVAGIFIAGSLALAQRFTGGTAVASRIVLGVGALLLLIAVGCALVVLKIRSVDAPPDGQSVSDLIKDVIAGGDPVSDERYVRHLHDRIKAWHKGNGQVSKANSSKATWLWAAQLCLGGAILTFAGLVGLELFGKL